MNPLISTEEARNLIAKFARESEAKLSIIFGAGASLGYSRQSSYRLRPPAVAQLLDTDNYIVKITLDKPEHSAIRGQRSHIQRRIANLGNDLEAYLSDIYSNDTEDDLFPSMLRYLEDVFNTSSQHVDLDDNHYQSLVSTVRELRGSRPWSILTFNYDTILEQSIIDSPRFIPRRDFKSDTNYLTRNPKVLKMHGGVNLRHITIHQPEREGNASSHEVFTNMMCEKRKVEDYLEFGAIGSQVPSFVGHRTYDDVGGRAVYNFPLMMIPIHTQVRSENTFFARQLEAGKVEISESKLTIAIGYQFGDNTFIDSLKGLDMSDSQLILVGTRQLLSEGTESRAYKNALKIWPEGNIHIFNGNGFGEFVDALY